MKEFYAIVTEILSRPVVVKAETKEEADGDAVAEVEEGDDGAIQGRYEGKAALVKLANLFLATKAGKEDSDDEDDEAQIDDKKQAVTSEIKKDLNKFKPLII